MVLKSEALAYSILAGIQSHNKPFGFARNHNKAIFMNNATLDSKKELERIFI